jgi:hypothetical protein
MPLIISTDKTQLTVFGNKTAYPVYLTIGNIPKAIRRKPSRQAQILIAYLPTSKLDSITNKTSRRRAQANLFHACMGRLLDQIKPFGISGIAMDDGHGVWHCCYPIFACYVADSPEQALVTGSLSGDCVIGATPWNQLENTLPSSAKRRSRSERVERHRARRSRPSWAFRHFGGSGRSGGRFGPSSIVSTASEASATQEPVRRSRR